MARYAAKYWPDHYRIADKKLVIQLSKTIVDYLMTSHTYDGWTRLHDADRWWNDEINCDNDSRDPASATYHIALLGLEEVLAYVLLTASVDVNAQGGHYGTALQTVSARGHEKVVQMLLDAGADRNAHRGMHDNTVQVTRVTR